MNRRTVISGLVGAGIATALVPARARSQEPEAPKGWPRDRYIGPGGGMYIGPGGGMYIGPDGGAYTGPGGGLYIGPGGGMYTGPGGGLYTGPGGGAYTGPGGGLYSGPGGGLYIGPGGGLYIGSCDNPFHWNWPPIDDLLNYLAEQKMTDLLEAFQPLKG